MCHYLGAGLHGKQKRVKAQSESSKSVVNSVLISREMPVFPGFLEIIRVVYLNTQLIHKKISTHLLTVLIICVILHAEQRKREKIKGSQGVPKIGKSSEVLSDR
ncbi:hypothetical protein DXC33_14615 [Clostridiaceae bacterium TF01-6]|nr:hypothetical protein DXC33_14615 [Clostridiaceae bacterium TF01-6]